MENRVIILEQWGPFADIVVGYLLDHRCLICFNVMDGRIIDIFTRPVDGFYYLFF